MITEDCFNKLKIGDLIRWKNQRHDDLIEIMDLQGDKVYLKLISCRYDLHHKNDRIFTWKRSQIFKYPDWYPYIEIEGFEI